MMLKVGRKKGNIQQAEIERRKGKVVQDIQRKIIHWVGKLERKRRGSQGRVVLRQRKKRGTGRGRERGRGRGKGGKEGKEERHHIKIGCGVQVVMALLFH